MSAPLTLLIHKASSVSLSGCSKWNQTGSCWCLLLLLLGLPRRMPRLHQCAVLMQHFATGDLGMSKYCIFEDVQLMCVFSSSDLEVFHRCCGVAVYILTGNHSWCWDRPTALCLMGRNVWESSCTSLICDLLQDHSFCVNSQSLLVLQSWGRGWSEPGVALFCPSPSAGLIVPSLLCRAPGNWYSCSLPHSLQLGEVRTCREGSFFTGLWKPPWPGGVACMECISCRFWIASWSLKSDAAGKVVLFVLFGFVVVLSIGTSFPVSQQRF